ncbi:hypothetical protein QOZ95_005443 [Paenibacillus brasilensis]|uniref:DUF4158 domain-containing protein n=1 Tax=Paenibacillus brasilensis TaxID=128574 RepID=A0ABU0L7G4_9BACL|nr:hypothetical protein [Paenibacillus brasilensis]
MRGKELLTLDQRLEWMSTPTTEWELATYYTFTQHDLDTINRHRRDYNRLGFAVQLALLRYPGWSITDIKGVTLPKVKNCTFRHNLDTFYPVTCTVRQDIKYVRL